MDKETLEKIIKEAEDFECCPNCGDWNNLGGHYCGSCEERYVTEEDAFFFAKYLKAVYEDELREK